MKAPITRPTGQGEPQSAGQEASVSPQSHTPLPQAEAQLSQLVPLHHCPAPQEPSVQMQPTVVPPQTGVFPEQAPQLGPQLPAVSQGTQLVPSQNAPGPHEVGSQTHRVPSQ